jgi:hypothetical protein
MIIKLTIQEFNGIMKEYRIRNLWCALRKKFIGSWFKQGDFGIVFAYRGIGKTRFALMMAFLDSLGCSGEDIQKLLDKFLCDL